jgi:hypothetical protein
MSKHLQIDVTELDIPGEGPIKTGDAILRDLYNLKYPDNIIDNDTSRGIEKINILKPSVISNTIGVFDPEATPKSDFRGMWERILEHTRNAQLYEHEYLTILRMVMKGSSANQLDKMSKESKGNLKQILEAIQDLYIPQMTYFDEYDELNSFTRAKGEHIRTTVRRASLAIFPLKATVSEGAWDDKRYTLIMQMIKQVIDRKTFNHLRMEEIKCAHSGSQLSLEAVIQLVSLFETSNNLVPSHDLRLSYDVHTMRLANQPDKAKSELEEAKEELRNEIRSSIKSLVPKKARIDKSIADRVKVRGRRRLDQNTPMQVDQPPPPRGQKRPADNGKPNYPVVPYQPPQTPYQPPTQHNQPQQAKQYTAPRGGKQYGYQQTQSYPNNKNVQPYKPNYQGGQVQYQRGSYTNQRYQYRGRGGRNRGRGRPRTYSFNRDKQGVVLNFYKCELCPSMHPDGVQCNDKTREAPLND